MHSKSDNIEVMTYDNANEDIEKIFESFLSRCHYPKEKNKKVIGLLEDELGRIIMKEFVEVRQDCIKC